MPALITTILPTYRRPQLLRRALRSVLAQTFPDFTVCVYDNASGDETRNIVADFASRDSRVGYYCHSQNIGAVANFNYGVNHVATPYFSMLSDDDLVMPELYERAIQAFQRYPAARAFCSKAVCYDPVKRSVRQHVHGLLLPELGMATNGDKGWQAGYYDPSASNTERMILNHFINTGVIFRTDIRNTIGVLNRFGSDIVYMARLANTHPFVVSEYTGGVWSVHENSFSAGQFRTPAETLDFILSFLITLLDLECLDVSDRLRFFHAFHELARRMLVGHCLGALAAGDLANFRAALDELRHIRVPFVVRLGAACADLLSRVSLAGSPAVSRLVGMWLRRGTARDTTAPAEADQGILRYIASLEAECFTAP